MVNQFLLKFVETRELELSLLKYQNTNKCIVRVEVLTKNRVVSYKNLYIQGWKES